MDRRSLIKGAGLTVALGTIRTVSARGEKIASSEVGIDSEVEKLLSDGQIEKAETILDQHDVEYYSKEELISNNSEQENDGTVSINGRYSESYSQLHMSLVNRGNDQWLVSAYGTLQGYLSRVRDASVIEDGCGIIFDSSEWSAPEPSREGVNLSATTDAPQPTSMNYEEYNPNYGVAASVNLPYGLRAPTEISMQTDLTRADTGNDDIPVQFIYEHTRAYIDTPGSISVGVTAGALDVDLSRASTAWKKEMTVSPTDDRDES